MPGARIDSSSTCHGLKAVVLENEHLCLTILPESGAKIYRLIHKAADADILWRRLGLGHRSGWIGEGLGRETVRVCRLSQLLER